MVNKSISERQRLLSSAEQILSDAFERNELKMNKFRKKKYVPKNKELLKESEAK